MRQLAVLALFLSSFGSAQVLVDQNRAAEILRQIDPQTGPLLRCGFTPVAPAITFTFRFQAGFLALLPLRQFHGPGHWVAILVRVAPQLADRQPVYLLRTFDLPDVPDTEFSAELGGAFLVGDGHYQVNAVLFDDRQRACRAAWQIQVKGAARYPIRLEQASVAPVSDAASWTPTADASIDRMTIFLHAAPLNPRSWDMQGSDVVMSVASLMALLEQRPARSVRLVVFNLAQGRELYRTEFFTVNDLDQVTHALDRLQLGLVDYKALQSSHSELLRALIQRELNEASRSSEVIFLGPDSAYAREVPSLSTQLPAPGQHFFYLQYRMPATWTGEKHLEARIDETGPRPPPPCQAVSIEGCNNSIPPAALPSPVMVSEPNWRPSDPDQIAKAVRILKGKVFVVRNAGDFANAVGRIARH